MAYLSDYLGGANSPFKAYSDYSAINSGDLLLMNPLGQVSPVTGLADLTTAAAGSYIASTTLSGSAAGYQGAYNPNFMYVDANGSMFMVNPGGSLIEKFSSAGTLLASASITTNAGTYGLGASVVGLSNGNIAVATYTAAGVYNADTTTGEGGAFTVLIPATITLGQSWEFRDFAGTWAQNNFTVNPNGHTIMGQASSLVCNVSGLTFALVYNGTTLELQ